MDDIVSLTGELIETTNFPGLVKGSPTDVVSKIRAVIFKNAYKWNEKEIIIKTFLAYTNNMPSYFNTFYTEAWDL